MRSYLYFFCCIIFCLTIVTCSSVSNPLGVYENFLPKAGMKNGVVHKYYKHFRTTENNDIATTIEYRAFQWTDDQNLRLHYFGPAFQATRTRWFGLTADALLLKSEALYTNVDTLFYTIVQPTFLDFQQTGKSLEASRGERIWKRTQTGLIDTMILDRPATIVTGRLTTTTIKASDTTQTEAKYRDVYIKDIGLFSGSVESSKETYQTELIEQMTMDQFQQLADHDVQRVGYIDPANTLFKNPDFELCSRANRIVDYYNGIPVAGYRGDKQTLREILRKEVDPKLLAQESGYLTFRFVINCKGKAGWFTTEMADLDYQKKEFNQETINHLGKIIAGLDHWQGTVVRGEARDAYAYLTFKLKNGKIIEILP